MVKWINIFLNKDYLELFRFLDVILKKRRFEGKMVYNVTLCSNSNKCGLWDL